MDNQNTPTPGKANSGLILAALGIVFGDIGTSPLYTLKTVISLSGGAPSHETALGLLSLIVWTLLITVSIKYISFVMRVDNDGEGGILALMSLLGVKRRYRPTIIAIGLFGAALIYGDGAITPAISVLSAVEGLHIAMPALSPYILPVSVVILLCLFFSQSQGTERIGWVFGPVMALWFFTIGLLGLWGILQHPDVLLGLNPWYGLHYLFTHGSIGFLVLGGVFLGVTGAEALYADMGHVGARSIRLAWYGLVLPALLLNYAGQTALVLTGIPIGQNIFYLLCPSRLLFPLIILATVATIIASQAIISGAFSMTRQAMQLGWFPHMHITQTSSEGYGQIYVGTVNWMLMVATIGITIIFGNSDNLAAAYGIAVSFTMLLTTALLYVAMREVWGWKLLPCVLIAGTFFIIDVSFFSANLLKIFEGGWVPIVLAAAVYVVMAVWHRGMGAVSEQLSSQAEPVDSFMEWIEAAHTPRVPGTAVFLTRTTTQTPPLMIWHVKTNRALHQHLIALTVTTESVPSIKSEERVTVEKLARGFWRVMARYGFMEKPDITELLNRAQELGCTIDLDDVTYYIGHGTILHRTHGRALPRWEQRLYAVMQRNAAHASDYFSLPRDSVVEIGRQVEI